MKSRLLWKLFAVHVLVIGVAILIVWFAIDYLASSYFMTLMSKYNISPTALHQMFLDAAHRYLIWASLSASALAIVLSFLLTRRILSPLSQMAGITRQIASGDYSTRLRVSSEDEIGQLAAAFNRMTASLQRIERLRRTMVIDVAHELRTPLTNMRAYLEGLSDGVIPPSEETFESLHEESLRLAQLVEDLLQLAKADASAGTLRREQVRLPELVVGALDRFGSQFASKQIAVDTRFATGMDPIMADPHKLAQAIRNLLQNAWQYTPRGGRLGISSECLPGRVKLVFANTGAEITQEDLPLIFERFYRAEKSRSRNHGGAGIGLAIVKELIEAHGGEVGAESSQAETRIWFALPT